MHVCTPRVGSQQASLKKISFTLLCYLLCGGDKIGNVLPADS